MQYVVLTRRDRTNFTDTEAEALFPAEASGVETLRREGFLLQIWDRADLAGACLLCDTSDEARLRQVLAGLPLFAAGMVAIERLVPLRPYG